MRLAAFLLAITLLPAAELTLERDANWLVIRSAEGAIRINYLEAYCRGDSTDADWDKHTVIRHKREVVSATPKAIRLRDTLSDGVTVDHTIRASKDAVDFQLTARNPGSKDSEVQWAQPCVRLGRFTGFEEDHRKGDPNDYLNKCFIFLNGRLTRFPTPQWATKARYMPGQVWRPAHVPATDVNPRPLSPLTPSNGLIGCFNGPETLIFATAWEPYQELFQGIARCVHSDFRIGGLRAGESKTIRGKIYVVPNDVPALVRRYGTDLGR